MPVLPLLFDELEGLLEILRDVLVKSVFESDLQVLQVLGELEGVGGEGADGLDLFFAEEGCIGGEMLAADPE